MREVEDCVTWSGRRPIEWLFDTGAPDDRWCVIHATHMTEPETQALARTGAVAGLCPVTEANLGDGIFPGRAFLDAGGAFGIGSDSNVLIGIPDELRQLEYSQRLHHRARNVLAPAGGSNGRALYDHALRGGAQALGAGPVGITTGAAADLLSLSPDHPTLAGKSGDAMLDAWIFAGGAAIDCVWVRGAKQVDGGRHRLRDATASRYRDVMAALAGRE
jgi:formiminoglutamate deiminase